MKILVSDGIHPLGEEILKNAGHDVVNHKYSQEELMEKISDFDAIMVRSATKVPKELIDAGNLKCIARGGVGLDNIDTVYAKEKGIPVLNTPGASSISVAELTLGHMLSVCRFIHRSKMEMMEGKWPKKDYKNGIELTGKTLGILGLGAIGKETAKRALGLGMKVIAYDPFVKETNLEVSLMKKDDLLAQADFIALHLPFIKEQGPTLAEAEFAKMKDGVVVVNCARGGTIKESALLDALMSGKVARAAIDVYENEPAGEAQKALINHPYVSVTPHIGASTGEAQIRVSTEIAQKVVDALK